MPRIDILTSVPAEISISILSYFDFKSLLTLAQVCRRWQELCDNDTLWRQCAEKMWKGKERTEMSLAHRLDYGPLAGHLNVKEMKDIIRLRKVNPKALIEKQDWIDCIVSSTPKLSPKLQSWPINKWKASFIAKFTDARRTIITKEELCSIEWLLLLIQEVFNARKRFWWRDRSISVQH